ncbi:hypothetical protein [Agromyces ramosus]|uniref:AAA+ ATPase domain-containing protein n=1 Tax=Agromyces ramosus TaxID=33879 RepID=A0ABU0R8U2_9MICO|nr:hypothetical protein [Agromyces ramosus]MDQ0894494.1 hypothetical protein [Agromyces ramosus]
MSLEQSTAAAPESDGLSDAIEAILGACLLAVAGLVALPLLVPVLVARVAGDGIATKALFWKVRRGHWIVNTIGAIAVTLLLATEAVLLGEWVASGGAEQFFAGDWVGQLAPTFGPWTMVNLLAGALLLPLTWSIRRRQIAERVRARRIEDVLRQERIEVARKRAADAATADRIGIRLDPQTGRITGVREGAVTVPHTVDGQEAFGFVTRSTVRSVADRFHDARQVRDWVDPTGRYLLMPGSSSAARALIIAESGSGKTVLINGLVLCALEYGWPVFVIDAKGDPADARSMVALAHAAGRTATIGGQWNLFSGPAEQVTAKLMRLMPVPDGANQHYLDEIRGVLQAVQTAAPIRSAADLRDRLMNPGPHVRDQFDLTLVNQTVDRNGATAGSRALQSLAVALRPLERWIAEDGWSYAAPPADLTVVPVSPVDDAQARLGDLLLLDLRNFLSARLEAGDKSPVLVIVDEFPQLVTGAQDPGDTAGSLFETARSAGVGLVLATQSPAGLSNDDIRRRRALTSGAALIFGRSKDPEEIVQYAGTMMRMEASGQAAGDRLGSARAQHTFVVPPQDVREAADGAFWLVQGGAIAAFRALPQPT